MVGWFIGLILVVVIILIIVIIWGGGDTDGVPLDPGFGTPSTAVVRDAMIPDPRSPALAGLPPGKPVSGADLPPVSGIVIPSGNPSPPRSPSVGAPPSRLFKMDFSRQKPVMRARRGKTSIPEQMTREVLMEMYQRDFITVRPDWLKNPETGRNLELDCYNAELGIAVEYDGEQHTNGDISLNWNKNMAYEVKKDMLKEELCRRNGVTLIRVPFNLRTKDAIKEYLLEKLRDRDNSSVGISHVEHYQLI